MEPFFWPSAKMPGSLRIRHCNTIHVGQMAVSWLPLEVVKGQSEVLRRLQSDSG